MLRIDFGQSLLDHSGVLILVQPVGYIGDKRFKAIFDEISTYRTAQVPNTTRTLNLRYSKRVSPQFIEWGNFHFHKRVLGLICVGRCTEISEVEKLEKAINEIKNPFSAILLNTRCFVFGCKSNDESKIRKDFALIRGEDHSEDLQSNLAEFVASLFNVLESKRISKLSEKIDKITLIQAPVEHEVFGGENDSRTSKRKAIGRSKKYTGDLCMLAGLPQEALAQYLIAGEHLRVVNDLLWLAGAMEGQCAASLVMTRTATEKDRKSLILPIECASNSVNLTMNGLGGDVDESKFRNPQALSEDDIVERLSEALKLYNRVKGAAVVETEANLKFTRLLIIYKRRIEASVALQNSLSVNVFLTEQEKIQRYSTAAVLYDELGFKRKAGFFGRIAAMQCVTPQLPHPLWLYSYKFLMGALDGYRISLNEKDVATGVTNGWPALQTRLLNELIFTARRLGDPALAFRHITFLLHTMYAHLSDDERKELCVLLESSAKQCTGSPRSPKSPKETDGQRIDALDMALVPLTKMPLVRSFKVNPLAPHMKPVGNNSAAASGPESAGPFIFSSLRGKVKQSKKSINTTWVCGDIGQVSLDVYNPMPCELRVSQMVLCVEGVEFEPYPTCLSLPPKAGPHAVMLLGIPSSAGPMRVTGYSVTVFGVESTCKLTKENLENKDDFPVIVDVCPSMPLIQVSTTLPKVRCQPPDPDTAQSAPLVTAVTLYAGQSMKGTITLENIGKMPVESLNISVTSKDGEGVDELFSFDEEEIKSKLPVPPGHSTDITVTITGAHRLPQGTESSDNPSYDPAAPWGLTGSIQFRYSTASNNHMSRKVTMAIDVTVVPSLICENYQIIELPSDRSHCLLMFDAVNKTSNDMELSFCVGNCNESNSVEGELTADGSMNIQGNDKNRITMNLPRFALPVSIDHSQGVDTDSQRRAEYKRRVCELVRISWNLPACNASGSGNVENLKLNSSMMQALRPDPVSFGVKINGEEYDNATSSGITISLCSIAELNVQVFNESDEPHGPLVLTIEPYQDQASGCPVTELDGKVAWVGTLQVHTPEVLPGKSFCHSCSLMFLYEGQFKLSISCTETASQQAAPSPQGTGSKSPERTCNSENTDTILKGEIHSLKRSWTYSPSVRVHVV
ncbi:trafficking protein particle complex subunit 9-like [Stylophora pistillata]|uniref:Trafficking protein particle complex subunit 9 n=1 Tax=Stylophora pistillata TaxID=50429 RepID=A0A2B4RCI9_STYPI|nr:trafficking protein particle complex subunit 9-like [Stylophora pistillata]PFX14220.1 Trafficking protein particle complex subunit 9 [Stylophora pistillata]